MYLRLILQCIKRCKSLFVLCFIKAHVMHCNNKAFYLETDFSFTENLACHHVPSNTTISCNDSLDSFWHSGMRDC